MDASNLSELERQASVAARETVAHLIELYGPQDAAIIFRGYVRGFAQAISGIQGETEIQSLLADIAIRPCVDPERAARMQ